MKYWNKDFGSIESESADLGLRELESSESVSVGTGILETRESVGYISVIPECIVESHFVSPLHFHFGNFLHHFLQIFYH